VNFLEEMQRAANALDALYAWLTRTLGETLPRHTTVLLPNHAVTRYFGGSDSLFPRVATFNMMPPRASRAPTWINTLTTNETRNLVQITKTNHGFGKVAYVLFGEAGLASAMAVTLPDWCVAGDARAAETTNLRGGIGLFASSEEVERTLLLSGQHYSYVKAMHGSFRDLTPNRDKLGAFLVSHVYRTAGPDAWNQILEKPHMVKYSNALTEHVFLYWTLKTTETTWARLLAYFTGLVNQEPLLQNEYLAAENGIWKAHLKPGLRLSNGREGNTGGNR
jgi:hypothetical protein